MPHTRSKSGTFGRTPDPDCFQRVRCRSAYAAGKRLRVSPLRAARVDPLVVDRVEVGVEPGVAAVTCSGFVGGRVEITRLIRPRLRLAVVPILLTAHGFT